MRKLTPFIILLIIGLLVAGCSKDTKESTDLDGKETGIEEKDTNTTPGTAPLTGLQVTDGADNRMVSVMVNNHVAARPQSGLAEADIVFEILAEGGITRFLALYQSEMPDVVGPVRSAREYYFKLANDYKALYIYHGAADFVDNMVVERGTEFLNGAIYDNDGLLFKRESFRKAPHNSYVQMDAVYDVAEEKGYDITYQHETLPFLDEEEIAALEGENVEQVQITYDASVQDAVEYVYDSATEQYNRFSGGVQTKNLDDEKELVYSNIFIIETFHEVIDEVGRRAIDFDTGGDAYLLQKGKIQPVQWKNINGYIVPVKDGAEIGFVPGKTWINVVPNLEQYVQFPE